MKKQKINIQTAALLTAALLGLTIPALAQNVSISPTGNLPDNSAALDIRDFTNKGVLIPRLTTAHAQRNAIPSPANSLLIFNTTTGCYEFRDGSKWVILSCGEKCNKPVLYYDERFNEGLNYTNVELRWTPVVGATGYSVSVSKNKQFTSFVKYNNGANSYNNVGVGNVTSMRINWDTVICNYPYFAVVSASTSCGIISSDTIKITTKCLPSCGSQVWMTANMNVGTMINGANEQSNDNLVEKYCYNDMSANCTTYGGLYQWAEVVQVPYTNNNNAVGTQPWMTCDPCGSGGRQGICPAGYHVPTDLEWSRYEWCVENNISPSGGTTLNTFQTVGGAWRGSTSSTAGVGAKLKASSSNSPSWDGTNASGFTVLLSGDRTLSGGFNLSWSFFWAATESSGSQAWSRYLSPGVWQSGRNDPMKKRGYSVRCLQN